VGQFELWRPRSISRRAQISEREYEDPNRSEYAKSQTAEGKYQEIKSFARSIGFFDWTVKQYR
jgi:hypothetical protein